MFMQLSGTTRAVIFTAIAFGLALLIACLGEDAIVFYMFTPLAATLVMVVPGIRKKSALRLATRLGLGSIGSRG